MDYIDYLIETCEQMSRLGDVKLTNGARLLGHTPHRAPEAYFHILNDGLLPGEIDALELIIKRPLPEALEDFYRRINGGHFWGGEISIYGLRRSYGRTVDDVCQPFAIETSNVLERPKGTPDSAVIFAGYFDDDGSQLAAFTDRPEVVAFLGGRIPDGGPWRVGRTWPNLETCLVSEFDRLGKLFDSEGRRIDPDARCSPIAQ